MLCNYRPKCLLQQRHESNAIYAVDIESLIDDATEPFAIDCVGKVPDDACTKNSGRTRVDDKTRGEQRLPGPDALGTRESCPLSKIGLSGCVKINDWSFMMEDILRHLFHHWDRPDC
jgi:hypothetical protein